MLQHARECARGRHPVHVRPGPGPADVLAARSCGEFVRLADYVAVNDYEGKMLEEKTGRKLEELAREVKALVVHARRARAR